MDASLDCPTKQAIGSGFEKGTLVVTSHLLCCFAVFMFTSPGPGQGWECVWSIITLGDCCWLGCFLHSLISPWGGLKLALGWDTLGPCGTILGTGSTGEMTVLCNWLHPLSSHQVLCPHPHLGYLLAVITTTLSLMLSDWRLCFCAIWLGPPLPLLRFGWLLLVPLPCLHWCLHLQRLPQVLVL